MLLGLVRRVMRGVVLGHVVMVMMMMMMRMAPDLVASLVPGPFPVLVFTLQWPCWPSVGGRRCLLSVAVPPFRMPVSMLPVRASVVESMRLSILLVLAAMVGVAVVLVLVLSRGTVLHHSTALRTHGS